SVLQSHIKTAENFEDSSPAINSNAATYPFKEMILISTCIDLVCCCTMITALSYPVILSFTHGNQNRNVQHHWSRSL
ncbi:hypothetical protein N665_0244s0028, partial [Sinapis alba]